MKLYKHFKNKPYRFIGTAKHSETLEDVVIYETLYDNPHGKLWVRPKPMFFETVTKENKTFPRFREIPLEIKTQTSFGEAGANIIGPLANKVFPDITTDVLQKKCGSYTTLQLCLGYVEEKLVGFKLGFATSPTTFHSWLGAVDPEFRGLGIASDLMKAQHQWCGSSGYKTIETRTKNKWKEMIILNLKFGFEIVGTYTDASGEPKLLLNKKI